MSLNGNFKCLIQFRFFIFHFILFRHPSIVISHIVFRLAAILFYLSAYLFTDSFIIQFLVIVSRKKLQPLKLYRSLHKSYMFTSAQIIDINLALNFLNSFYHLIVLRCLIYFFRVKTSIQSKGVFLFLLEQLVMNIISKKTVKRDVKSVYI